MRHIIVAAGIEGRLRSAEKIANEVERLGHKVHLHIDSELVGATRAWCDAVRAYVKEGNFDTYVMLPDDCELSDHYDPDSFAEEMRKRHIVLGDMQANHVGAPSAYEAGYGYYTTTDGITAFGLVGKAYALQGVADLVEAMDHKLQFDECCNVFAQQHGSRILKPTMSMVEHTLEFPSLQGNDGQPVGMRRTQHFDPSKPLPSSESFHLGRTYLSNHWRFLWTMGSEARKASAYVVAAYAVHQDAHVSVVPERSRAT